jgi:hypothetical protein
MHIPRLLQSVIGVLLLGIEEHTLSVPYSVSSSVLQQYAGSADCLYPLIDQEAEGPFYRVLIEVAADPDELKRKLVLDLRGR